MKNLNVSVVLFKNNPDAVKKAINSCLSSKLIYRVYLIDNSPTDELSELSKLDHRIVYIFNNTNLGFGKAHNIALRKSIEEDIPYHLVLNPDVYFEEGVLEGLYNFMENNPDVGLVMPKALYPDGKLQYLCKLLPTPIDLFGRRFLNFGPFKKFIKKRNEIYELRFTGYDKIMEVPYLSGCCMFLRTNILKKVGLFDEKFFMYLEDTDLTRRIHKVAKTIYFPYVHIYHEYGKGSYKNFKLLYYHIDSAIKYFNKWGWFFDKERDRINKKAIEEIKFPENSFDVITMNHVIEHVLDPITLLSECKRILKPNGKLIVITPNIKSLGHRFFKTSCLHLDPPRHIYLFSPKSLITSAEKAGLKIKNVFTPSKGAYFIWLASRLIRKNGNLPGGTPERVNKSYKLEGLLFWGLEYNIY